MKKVMPVLLAFTISLSTITIIHADDGFHHVVTRDAMAYPSYATMDTPVTLQAELNDEMVFYEWIGVYGLELGKKESNTTLYMPDHEVHLTAAYRPFHWHIGADKFTRVFSKKTPSKTLHLSKILHRTTGWWKYRDHWYFIQADNHPAVGWNVYKHRRYYFNQAGIMQKGWMEMDQKTYHFDDSGALSTGWTDIDGQTYYFDPQTGVMAKGITWIEGKHYLFDENGAYLQEKEDVPSITGDFAFVYNDTDDLIVYDKKANERIWPASMTKMMTIILALENLQDLHKTIVVSEEKIRGLLEAGLTVINYQPGDTATIEDLLYTTCLPSAADSANLLAYEVSGSLNDFVALMNKKAMEIGMSDTHFANCHGNDDLNNYSTCHDMARLLSYGMQNELFRKIISTYDYTIGPTALLPEGETYKSIVLMYIKGYGEHRYQFEIPGAIGGKSGYTPSAGYTLAIAVNQNDKTYIYVIGKSFQKQYYPSHVEDVSILSSYFR